MNQKHFLKTLVVVGIIFLISATSYCALKWKDIYLTPFYSSSSSSSTDSNASNNTLTISLGKEFVLKKGEIARSKDQKVSLRIRQFIYSPCPKGAQCFWSGLAVIYEIAVDGKIYGDSLNPLQESPYEVVVKQTDYKTYASFIINKKSALDNASSSKTGEKIEYTDSQYGFRFYLPQDWKGYSIVVSEWQGYTAGPNGNMPAERGPLISIRNPKWTAKNPYQDIPIMVFTLEQWGSLQKELFHIGAAPVDPSELGRNSRYVFALPARYNFAFPAGWEEVESILNNHPFQIIK